MQYVLWGQKDLIISKGEKKEERWNNFFESFGQISFGQIQGSFEFVESPMNYY